MARNDPGNMLNLNHQIAISLCCLEPLNVCFGGWFLPPKECLLPSKTLGRPPPTHRQFTFWSAAGWIHYPLDLLGEISMHQLVPTPPLWAGWDGNKRKDWRWHLSQNGTIDHPPPICKTCHAENSCVIFFYDTRQATTHPQAIHFLECCWLDPLSFGSPW